MTSFVIEKIQLRNVRCYGDDIMEMDFPLNNLTVFTGHVGAGKSTILKSVSMALYGEDGGAKGEKLAIDDMINEKNGKNLEIHLYIHSTNDADNSEHKYEIHLFHKHSKYNNKLVFVKDGKDISLESKTATYELIEKTFIPKNVYHNIYYFTQQAKNFFTALPNGEQKEIFNSILDLSEYASYYENSKLRINDAEKDCVVKETKINSEKNACVTVEQMKNKAVYDLEQFKELVKQKCVEIKKQIDELNERLCDFRLITQEDIDKVNSQINEIENKKKIDDIKIKNEISKLENEIDSIEEKFKTTLVPMLKNKYIQLNNESMVKFDLEISKLKDEINSCELQINNLKNEVITKTNSEIKKIEDKYNSKINNIKLSVNDKNSEYRQLEAQLTSDKYKVKNEIQEEVNKLKEEKKPLVDESKSISWKITANQETISNKEDQIKKYEEDLNNPDAVCSLCGQKLVSKDHVQKHIDKLKSEIDLLKQEVFRYNDSYAKYVDDIKKIDDEIQKHVDSFKFTVDKLNADFLSKKIALKNAVDVLNTELVKIENDKNNEINEVKHKYTYDSNNEYETKKQSFKQKILDIELSKQKSTEKLREEYKKEFNLINSERQQKIEDVKKQINVKISELSIIEIDYKDKISKIYEIKSDLEQIKKDRENIECDIESKKLEFEKYSDSKILEDKQNQISDMVNTMKEFESKIKKMTDEYKKSLKNKEILEFWKSAFSDSGIKSMLIDSAIPHMNECVSSELNRVAPGLFTVSFDTLSETKSGKVKDKFNINIVNNMKGSTGHKKLSGGEKRIIDLCCMSALRSLAEKLYNKKFCHIFYDEILDSLDDECKQLFCANIKKQSTDGCNITLVTHDLPEDVDPDRTFPF